MRERLVSLLNNSYAPISGKSVAAIVNMKDGTLFSGVNVENPSFKSGMCAEQVAIGRAITAGYKNKNFDSIYIMDDDNTFCEPCFLCRQNFVDLFDNDVKIILLTIDGKEKVYKLDEICPHPFRMED